MEKIQLFVFDALIGWGSGDWRNQDCVWLGDWMGKVGAGRASGVSDVLIKGRSGDWMDSEACLVRMNRMNG
jgi:hypothetical protein